MPGSPFQATLHLKSGGATIPAGTAALTVPTGWTVDAPKPIGPTTSASESTVTFTVTPSGTAASTNFKISALVTSGASSGYTDNVVRIVPAVEGRFHRWGKWGEFDSWLNNLAPAALRLGRSAAVQSMPINSTIPLQVDVHNWSTVSQSGSVTLTLPAGFTADALSKPYGPLAGGADTTVTFQLTNTDTTLPGAAINETSNTIQQRTIGIATSYSSPAASASENLSMSLLPTTAIPQAAAAPTVDGLASAGEYTGPALDLSRRWSGGGNCPAFPDCGTQAGTLPGDPNSTYAKVDLEQRQPLLLHPRQATTSRATRCFRRSASPTGSRTRSRS